MIAGMFGFMTLLLAFFFSTQYFVSQKMKGSFSVLKSANNVSYVFNHCCVGNLSKAFKILFIALKALYICYFQGLNGQKLPETDKFLINGQYGETVFCLLAGVSFIWFFSLIDCLGLIFSSQFLFQID